MSVSDNGSRGGGGGGPRQAISSKARHLEAIERRRSARARVGSTGVEAGGAGAATTPNLGDEDPNSPRRTRRTRSFWALAREFWTLVHGRRRTLIACIGTVTVAALVGLAVPASTKIALDYILTNNPGPAGLPAWVPTRDPVRLLWLLGAALMGVTLVAISVAVWGRAQMTRLTQTTRARVRRRVFDHAVRLPLHRVYELKSGGAASILREDAGQAADLLFSLLYNPWRAIVQLVGTMIILGATDWKLLAGAVLLVPAAWFTQKTWIARIRPLHREVRVTRTMIDAHATEAFGGMRVVRGFSRQRAEAARFIRNNHLMSRQEMLAWWWSRIIEVVWMVLLPLGSVAVLIYGGRRVIEGSLTLGDVMMFSAYLLMLLGPLESLSASATSIQAELASLDRILDLLNEPTEFGAASPEQTAGASLARTHTSVNADDREGVDPARIRGEVSFRGVSFKYPKARDWVLEDITLDVPAGATVALVGPSGAGKTTLCNLVARFYDPTLGAIFLDGRDVRGLGVESYRRLLGIVEQDVFLFDGTVRENIAYARCGATEEQVRAAAAAANADGFIERLERGYGTLIGERGVRLSGGQKQRIAIARALLADPRILILDEATSNLDSESEALIQDALRVLMRGRTCFVIAHRLSTVRNADLIAVLENGKIIERGTHAELVEREGRYHGMLMRQIAQPDSVPPTGPPVGASSL